ncbi:MAG: response regulator [Candidatus Zapsychrus exili]|nr:response regulator [Candidatus Zapsychrus exili]
MAKKILIVDDEPEIISMVELRLQAAGYEVITASDGQEGLDKAKEELPDLVILDVMMPKMDGYKVCGLLKADTRFHNIPIVMFTAKAQQEDQEMSEEVGANAYINKPFNSEELLGTLKDLIGE